MAKSARFKKNRESSSKNHKKLADILNDLYPIARIYEEYPYDKILEHGYKIQKNRFDGNIKEDRYLMATASKLRADFFIKDLNIIIEVQGEHHFQPITYNNLDGGWAEFEHRKHLDKMKRLIANEGEAYLIEISYMDDFSKENISRIIQASKIR